MAIPLSNEMREVRAPRTAELRPVDNQQFLQNMGNMALGMNRQMQEQFRGGLKLGQEILDQRDAFKRNEAERIYNERTTELNTELAQKEGEERVKFQPKYEAEMKRASDTYEAAINKVHNFEIREGSKRSINAWNNRNASNYQYENYKNETNLQEKAMGQALITDNNKRINAVSVADTAESLFQYANDPDLGFAHGEQLIRDFYKNRMGLPDEVVDQYVKDYKSKGYLAMANRLVQVTKETTGNAAYTPALNFLNMGINNGDLDPTEGIKMKRELETERLNLNVAHHPEWFVGKDGKFNPHERNRYAPDLTQYEYERIIKNAEQAAQSHRAAIEGPVKFALQDRLRSEELDFRLNTGLVTKDDLKIVARMLGKNPESEKVMGQLSKFFAERLQNTSRNKIRKHLVALEQTRNRPVIIDVSGELISENPTAQDIQDATSNNSMRVIYPWQDDSELNKAIEAYGDMTQIGGLIYNDKDLKPGWFERKDVAVDRKVDDMVQRIFDQNAKYGNHEISYKAIDDVATTALELLASGFQVPEGKAADGKIKYRTIQLDVNQISNDRSPEEAYAIATAIKESMRRTMPADMVQEMAQRMKDYQSSRHPIWSPLSDMSGERPGGLFTTTMDIGGGMAVRVPRLLVPITPNSNKEFKKSWNDLLNKISPQTEGLTHKDEDIYEKCAADTMQELMAVLQED